MTRMAARLTIVTGTDTGVGKTIATAAIAATSGPDTVVIKPVQTGVALTDPERCDGDRMHGARVDAGVAGTEPPDIETVARLTGVGGRELARLAEALAPDTAARRAATTVPSIADHAATIRAAVIEHQHVIVEGAGGLLVRLDTAGGTVLDLIVELGDLLPSVVVVTRAGLGTLNHTELTVRALRAAGVEPEGLIIGAWPREPDLAQRCNATELPRVSAVPLLAVIPAGVADLSQEQFIAAAPTWFVTS